MYVFMTEVKRYYIPEPFCDLFLSLRHTQVIIGGCKCWHWHSDKYYCWYLVQGLKSQTYFLFVTLHDTSLTEGKRLPWEWCQQHRKPQRKQLCYWHAETHEVRQQPSHRCSTHCQSTVRDGRESDKSHWLFFLVHLKSTKLAEQPQLLSQLVFMGELPLKQSQERWPT